MASALRMMCDSLGRKGALPPRSPSFKPWSNHGARLDSLGRGVGPSMRCAAR